MLSKLCALCTVNLRHNENVQQKHICEVFFTIAVHMNGSLINIKSEPILFRWTEWTKEPQNYVPAFCITPHVCLRVGEEDEFICLSIKGMSALQLNFLIHIWITLYFLLWMILCFQTCLGPIDSYTSLRRETPTSLTLHVFMKYPNQNGSFEF